MKLVSLVLACSLVASTSGCGWIIQDLARDGAFDPPAQTHHEDDDSSTALIVGVAAGAALVALLAVVAVNNKGRDRERPAPMIAPAPVPMIVPSLDPEDERLQRLFVQGHLSAKAGRCEATISIAKHLAQTNPPYYARYASDATIASCLP